MPPKAGRFSCPHAGMKWRALIVPCATVLTLGLALLKEAQAHAETTETAAKDSDVVDPR